MRTLRIAVDALLWGVVGVAVTAGAAAASTPVVLHPKWSLTRAIEGVSTDGRYVFLETPAADRAVPPVTGGILIDEKTGSRTRIARPDCSLGLSGPWLTAGCWKNASSYVPGQSPPISELKPLSGGSWRKWPFVSDDMGSYWSGFAANFSCPGNEHCTQTASASFVNIFTGKRVLDPTSTTTIPDLNSPGLAKKVCTPLRVPRQLVPQGAESVQEWGSLTFYGRFAVADGENGTFLERCASHSRMLIHRYGTLVGTEHVLIWQSTETQLSGVFLPSMRRFTITLPSALEDFTLALSERHLYLSNWEGAWSTPTPRVTS